MAVRCGLRWDQSKLVLNSEDTRCGGAGCGDGRGPVGVRYEFEVNHTDDENDFDQWDSSWYWDNGFADLSLSQSGSLNDDNGDDDDDDDVEILPNPDNCAPFDSREPAMVDINDDDIIVWQDGSLVGDFDDVECEYQTSSDVIQHPPIQFSMVYTICRPMFELNLPASQTTWCETQTSGSQPPGRVRHASSDDDVISSAENEVSIDCRTQSSIDMSQSPSFETLQMFGTSEWDSVESHIYDKSLSLICDNPPLVVASVEPPGGRQTNELTNCCSDDVIRCIECDRTLAWFSRLRVSQHRQFEACVLIGLCVGLCLGLGTGVLIGSLASRQSLIGHQRACSAQAGNSTIDVEKNSSGVIWREKLEEIMSENERLEVKLSTIENEIIRLLRRAQGTLSELSTSLEILSDMELMGMTSVEPVDRILDFELNELVHDEL